MVNTSINGANKDGKIVVLKENEIIQILENKVQDRDNQIAELLLEIKRLEDESSLKQLSDIHNDDDYEICENYDEFLKGTETDMYVQAFENQFSTSNKLDGEIEDEMANAYAELM